jgi:hypothetical protein
MEAPFNHFDFRCKSADIAPRTTYSSASIHDLAFLMMTAAPQLSPHARSLALLVDKLTWQLLFS